MMLFDFKKIVLCVGLVIMLNFLKTIDCTSKKVVRDIIQIDAMSEVVTYIRSYISLHGTTKKIMVLFDFDDTLVTSEKPLSVGTMLWAQAYIQELIQDGLTFEQALKIVTRIYGDVHKWGQESPQKYVEHDILDTIQELQSLVHKMMIVTARPTRSINATLQLAQSIGFNFKATAFNDAYIFNEHVEYRDGILFVGEKSKGQHALHLCEIGGFSPDLVILVDDGYHNFLTFTEQLADKEHIDFVGFHYMRMAKEYEKIKQK